jgi:hypothetical protein
MKVNLRRFNGWRLLALVLLVFGLLLMLAGKAQAATVTNDVHIPVSGTAVSGCPGGESVDLSGSAHLLFHATIDSAGGVHGDMHVNYQGVSGIGEISGAKYQIPVEVHINTNGHVGSETTTTLNAKLIGQGPDNNEVMHMTFHVTVNANGTVTASFDHFFIKCQ